MQPSVPRAFSVDVESVADVDGLGRTHSESTAGTPKDRSVWLGHPELAGDQHRIEGGLQAQRPELRALVVPRCVGDRGQPHAERPQRAQARQCVVEELPGSPHRRCPAFLTLDYLAVAEKLPPAGKEVPGAMPAHQVEVDLAGQVARVVLVGQRTPLRPGVISSEQLAQPGTGRRLVVDQGRVDVKADGDDLAGRRRGRAQLRRESHWVHVRSS